MTIMRRSGHPALAAPRETPIFSIDGKQIGTVKEVRGEYLKVNARWARDYWLTSDEVLSADGREVRLVIPSDELNLYKLTKPVVGAGLAGRATNAAHDNVNEQQLLSR